MFVSCLNSTYYNDENTAKLFEKIVFYILSISLCTFSLLDLNFYRFIRNMVPVNFAYLTIFWRENKKSLNLAPLLSKGYIILLIVINRVLLRSFDLIIPPLFK